MTLTSVPTRTAGSLGATKANARQPRTLTEWVSAAEYNLVADTLIDLANESLKGLRSVQFTADSATVTISANVSAVVVSGITTDQVLTLPTCDQTANKSHALLLFVRNEGYDVSLEGAGIQINAGALDADFALLAKANADNFDAWVLFGWYSGENDIWIATRMPSADEYGLGIPPQSVYPLLLTGNHVFQDGERWAQFSTTGGARTATAPTDGGPGREFTVDKTTTDTNALNVTSTDGTTFHGSAGPVACPGSTSAAIGSWTWRLNASGDWRLVAKVT